MSDTGLDVFDKTLHTTHVWLDDISDALKVDRQASWHLLGATLRTLRDKLPADLAAHLSAQLPLLVRGLYYEQYDPAKQPEPLRNQEQFIEQVRATPGITEPVDHDTVQIVLRVFANHVDHGLVEKIRNALPNEVRPLMAA